MGSANRPTYYAARLPCRPQPGGARPGGLAISQANGLLCRPPTSARPGGSLSPAYCAARLLPFAPGRGARGARPGAHSRLPTMPLACFRSPDRRGTARGAARRSGIAPDPNDPPPTATTPTAVHGERGRRRQPNPRADLPSGEAKVIQHQPHVLLVATALRAGATRSLARRLTTIRTPKSGHVPIRPMDIHPRRPPTRLLRCCLLLLIVPILLLILVILVFILLLFILG
jgi:hypothetical protein